MFEGAKDEFHEEFPETPLEIRQTALEDKLTSHRNVMNDNRKRIEDNAAEIKQREQNQQKSSYSIGWSR